MMTSVVPKRAAHRSLALAILLASASVPVPAWSGCGMDHGHAAAEGGRPAQVDPKTGAPSMPEPAARPADPTDGVHGRAMVVPPGTTAAGSHEVQVGDPQVRHAAPPSAASK